MLIGNPRWRPPQDINKPLEQLKTNCPGRSFEGPLQSICFIADRKAKMATTARHRLTLGPIGKCSNDFFSETTNMNKANLCMNVHWMALYKR
jgi:hypothetical protein